MKIFFAENAWEDYLYWQQTDKKILKRVNLLIKDIQREPFRGIGKPEPLKFNRSGYIGLAELIKSTAWFIKYRTRRYLSHNAVIIIKNPRIMGRGRMMQ